MAMVVSADAIVDPQYSQFLVEDVADRRPGSDEADLGGAVWPEDDPCLVAVDRLATDVVSVAMDGWAVVGTRIDTGDAHVHVACLDAAPVLETDAWDDVMDVSFRSVTGDTRISGLLTGPVEGLPNIAWLGPGDYRIRVCAGNVRWPVLDDDMGPGDLDWTDLHEDFAVLVWPAPVAEVTVHKRSPQRQSPPGRAPERPRSALERAAADALTRLSTRREGALRAGEGVAVTRELVLPARPEQVFAWVAKPFAWLGVGHVEFAEGGRLGAYLVVGQEYRLYLDGRFVAIDPPRRVTLTAGFRLLRGAQPDHRSHPVPPGSTTIDVAVLAAGGQTRLRLVHDGLPSAWAPDLDAFWAYHLDRLTGLCSGEVGDPPAW